MDSIMKWLGNEQMARLLVPNKKIKIVGRNGVLKLRDADCVPYQFSPADLIAKWSEEVQKKTPINWGWILSKLQKTSPGIVVNSTYWEPRRPQNYVAKGAIYHWLPGPKTCTCPAFRQASQHKEMLDSMGLQPWCKHLTLLDPLAPHFQFPLPDPHGFVSFQVSGEFAVIDGNTIHSIVQMMIDNKVWEFPQTEEGRKLLFNRLISAHPKGFQIRNLLEVK